MSERHERVVSLIRELAAAFIQNEANPNPLITVTRVTTSPDYRNVTIYITTIPEGREDDAVVFLTRHGSDLRSYLKKKSNLKYIPNLTFAIDHGERHRQHIDDLSREI
jgi:ribosome-binding factor A